VNFRGKIILQNEDKKCTEAFMDLKVRSIGKYLNLIKQLKGVESVVLIQRDGNPIQSAGVLFSKVEIFNIGSATSAIFNAGIYLHPNDLKYILIEGKKARILVVPLNSPIDNSIKIIPQKQGILDNKHEFFIVITLQPNTNLKGFFLQTKECLEKIKLITSGVSSKPPLVQFDVKENENVNFRESSFSLNLSESVSMELRKVLNNISKAIPDLRFAYITIEGGFIASKILKQTENTEEDLNIISAMSYSLFQAANRCSWLLKKMIVDKILLDCENKFHFIVGLEKAIFSAEIGKSRQKLGLIRLIIPQFRTKIQSLIQKGFEDQQ
jgi:predicted regulator of Ras-like GTPase activity (Roadblock/LC7/MglB family)